MTKTKARHYAASHYRDDCVTPRIAMMQNMHDCCPDFGTLACIDCALGLQRPRDMCNACCTTCSDAEQCPCTLAAWQGREEHTT